MTTISIMNFRQVGKKIRTIGNVKKITKAMQMVAAVKMKKAQTVALQGQPYRDVLQKMIGNVIDQGTSKFIKQDGQDYTGKTLYILISSNKGLCGSFNFNVIKLALREIDFNNSSFITLGKKGSTLVSKMGGAVQADFSDNVPFIDNVSAIFTMISQSFLSGEYSKIAVVYNKFISTFKIVPSIEPILPISKEELIALQKKGDQYIIEPDKASIVESLLNDYLKEKITGAILDSEASEHSSRMMAMKNATDNAGDIIFNLTLLKNKLRQASITNELLDITTAKISTEDH